MATAGQNEATIRRFYNLVINNGILSELRNFVEKDVFNDAALNVNAKTGLGNMRDELRLLNEALDLIVIIEEMIVTSSTVVSRLTLKGTHVGFVAGLPASGRPFQASSIEILHMRDDKIYERYAQSDLPAVLQANLQASGGVKPVTTFTPDSNFRV